MNYSWYLDIPYADRLYGLCLDIYLARELQMYSLEEDLFAKLIFALRSRETFVKFVRKPSSVKPKVIIVLHLLIPF